MSSTEYDASENVAPPIEQKSRWEDYIDVFFSPTDLFRRRGEDSFTVPFVTLILLSELFYFILLPATGMIMRSAMVGVPPEAAAKMAGVLKFMAVIGAISTPIVVAIGVTIAAALLWAIARLVDAKPTFGEMMNVAVYAGFIGLLGQIAVGVAVMAHGEAGLVVLKHTSFGVLRFVDPASMPKTLVPLIARIDIFKIWQAVIWAIGFQVVTDVSKAKAALVAAGTWFIIAVPAMLGGGVSKMGNVQIKTGD